MLNDNATDVLPKRTDKKAVIGTFTLLACKALLVVAWSSGFVGARFSIDYTSALVVVFWRCVLVTVILFPFVILQLRRASLATIALNAGIGLLAMAGYLAGVVKGIELGVSAGLAALMADRHCPAGADIFAPKIGQRGMARLVIGRRRGADGQLGQPDLEGGSAVGLCPAAAWDAVTCRCDPTAKEIPALGYAEPHHHALAAKRRVDSGICRRGWDSGTIAARDFTRIRDQRAVDRAAFYFRRLRAVLVLLATYLGCARHQRPVPQPTGDPALGLGNVWRAPFMDNAGRNGSFTTRNWDGYQRRFR